MADWSTGTLAGRSHRRDKVIQLYIRLFCCISIEFKRLMVQLSCCMGQNTPATDPSCRIVFGPMPVEFNFCMAETRAFIHRLRPFLTPLIVLVILSTAGGAWHGGELRNSLLLPLKICHLHIIMYDNHAAYSTHTAFMDMVGYLEL